MGMVVIQPYILVSKLKKIKTKFLRCTGYLNSIKNPIKQDLLQILVLVQQQNFLNKKISCMVVSKCMRCADLFVGQHFYSIWHQAL